MICRSSTRMQALLMTFLSSSTSIHLHLPTQALHIGNSLVKDAGYRLLVSRNCRWWRSRISSAALGHAHTSSEEETKPSICPACRGSAPAPFPLSEIGTNSCPRPAAQYGDPTEPVKIEYRTFARHSFAAPCFSCPSARSIRSRW